MISTTFKRRGIDSRGGEGTGALAGRVGEVKIVPTPFEDVNGGGGGGDAGKERGGIKTPSDEETKEAELEKRRRDRAAQLEGK